MMDSTNLQDQGAIHPDGAVTPLAVQRACQLYDPPFYLYDEAAIINQCYKLLNIPQAFGLTVRYAMKANPNRAILDIISGAGIKMEMSSFNEAKRAHHTGIAYSDMLLTSQYTGPCEEQQMLMSMIESGLSYTICSLKQLREILKRSGGRKLKLSLRIHPGEGSGESASRDTGSAYASFGMMKWDVTKAYKMAAAANISFDRIHVHIGSGSDPQKWMQNVNRTLDLIEKMLPDVTIVNLGGGYRVKRMPHEIEANIDKLGQYAKEQLQNFAKKTGRKLQLEIEPGSFIIANSGFLVTRVIDKKPGLEKNFTFIILNGGMEYNIRPLMYGSEHPFYLFGRDGQIKYSEFQQTEKSHTACAIVGRCCETGDSQSIDKNGKIKPRQMIEPEINDIFLIGGTGAYCAAMAPHNYNSYLQAPELLLRTNGHYQLIKRGQTLEQVMMNELPLVPTLP